MSEINDTMKEARKRAKIDGLKLKSKINIEKMKDPELRKILEA